MPLHFGWLMVSAKRENMMLKDMLILNCSLLFATTEWTSHDGKIAIRPAWIGKL